MNRFNDFSTEQLIGEKISIDKILNKEIKVLAFRLKNSKIVKLKKVVPMHKFKLNCMEN